MYVLGEKVITVMLEGGIAKKMRFQIADVTRILVSVGKVTKAGNQVIMEKDGGKVVDANGAQFSMEMENGVYIMRCMVKVDRQAHGEALCFQRQAQ